MKILKQVTVYILFAALCFFAVSAEAQNTLLIEDKITVDKTEDGTFNVSINSITITKAINLICSKIKAKESTTFAINGQEWRIIYYPDKKLYAFNGIETGTIGVLKTHLKGWFVKQFEQ